MSIVSLSFFGFLATTLLLYYIFPLRFRWVVLLVASMAFLLLSNGEKQVAVMLGMIALAWLCALITGRLNRALDGLPEGARQKRLSRCKTWLVALTIVAEAAILILYKDNGFFINNANTIFRLTGYPHQLALPEWVAPMGISYYTLILIGYILDVAWGTSVPQKNPLKFALFSAYFPQMTSGPFVRYHQMEGELFTGHRLRYANLVYGGQRVLWGLFKELVIAQRLGIILGTIYGNTEQFPGLYVLLGVVCYTLQVYMDFSGCMDIIIGTSEMFGIKMPENFQTPFFSTSLSEVWRRWHMTLGFWVKDYVLYPVLKSNLLQAIGRWAKAKFGKDVGKRLPTYIGMFFTWFTVGFWHGGSWKFIFGSGLFFFVMIVGGQLLEPLFQWLIRLLRINTKAFSWTLFRRIRTFLLFASSVSFGRAASLGEGIHMWKSLFTTWNPWILVDNSLFNLNLDWQSVVLTVASLLLVLVVSILQQRRGIRERIAEQNLVFRWALTLGLIFAILFYGCYGPGYSASDFIYGGF